MRGSVVWDRFDLNDTLRCYGTTVNLVHKI
jgi:hypothetical protein